MFTKIAFGKITAAAIALAAAAAAPALGHGPASVATDQGQRGPRTGMMGLQMMAPFPAHGPGWMGQGGMHHGPGWMGQGMHHGPGWMGHGMHHGPGWMGPGMGGHGFSALQRDVTADDVKHMLEHRLQWQGFTNLHVGDIAEKDDDTLTAEVVTEDGTVVQRFEVNRHTGAFSPAQ